MLLALHLMDPLSLVRAAFPVGENRILALEVLRTLDAVPLSQARQIFYSLEALVLRKMLWRLEVFGNLIEISVHDQLVFSERSWYCKWILTSIFSLSSSE